MIVTRELVKYALGPGLVSYRKLVGMHIGADEIFWQTLVLNIPSFAQTVSQQGWFLRWGHGKTDHSPDTLTESYEASIVTERKMYFFMRKVSVDDSPRLLDDIDAIAEPPDAVPSPVAGPGEAWAEHIVACPAPEAAQHLRWTGSKSRKQLMESYRWYMEHQ